MNLHGRGEPQVNHLSSALGFKSSSAWLGVPEKVTGNGLMGVTTEGWRTVRAEFLFPSVSKFVSIVSFFFSLLLKWDLGPVRDNSILTENSAHRRQGRLHCPSAMCNRDYTRRKQKNYATETAAASKQEERDPLEQASSCSGWSW